MLSPVLPDLSPAHTTIPGPLLAGPALCQGSVACLREGGRKGERGGREGERKVGERGREGGRDDKFYNQSTKF